jgi:hypothetical protein
MDETTIGDKDQIAPPGEPTDPEEQRTEQRYRKTEERLFGEACNHQGDGEGDQKL